MWNHAIFSANRDRRSCFAKALTLAEWPGRVSDERFSVDGTLIEVWAAMKRLVKRMAARRRRMAAVTRR